MPSCGKHLHTLKEANLSAGPAHLQIKPQGITPTPLVPISISTGVDFVGYLFFAFVWFHFLSTSQLKDLLDVNTLELARQLTLVFSRLLREIRVRQNDRQPHIYVYLTCSHRSC